MKLLRLFMLFFVILLVTGCAQEERIEISRADSIPAGAEKMTPELDRSPPMLYSDEFEQPVPLAVINTAGAEDSPFIPLGGDELYFFFTPDVSIPVEKQLLDGVTGIWMSKQVDGAWQEPTRVYLQDAGKLSLDGCEFVRDDKMLFCTAREGYTGLHWGTAERVDGVWSNWKVDDFNPSYEVGELHIHEDELYYHSVKSGGKGENDIWMLSKTDGSWQNPVNVEIVNTEAEEGMPYISQDGKELWFNRWYQGTPALFRSYRIDGDWQEPELIISTFAGEPTLDKEGNVYFVHHYYDDGVMLEADIYVAYRK